MENETPLPPPTPASVEEWLARLGLEAYAATFAENAITPGMLARLTDEDLKTCGVHALGHRKMLLQEIARLPHPVAAPAPAPTTAPREPAAPAPVPVSSSPDAAAAPAAGPSRRGLWVRIIASKFLVVSIAVHLLFGVGATLYVVQRYSANRKLTFQGGAPTTNPSKRAMEHQVSMAKKKNSMSAPAQAKRITTAGLSKIVLPDMPTMPTATTVVPNRMGGMGGVGTGMGPAGGMGGGGGGGGGGGMTMFGFRDGRGGGMAGTFYDLKKTHDGKPSGMDVGRYSGVVAEFTKHWDPKVFAGYFQGPKPLYMAQLYIPVMDADEGPKAFDLAKKVQPKMWVVHYKGEVAAPEAGKFRFVGKSDDLIIVRFAGRLVLDWSQPDAGHLSEWHPHEKAYPYPGTNNFGCMPGDWLEVEAGKTYPLEILIGERPGGLFSAYLMMEKEGAHYESHEGLPKFPLFRVADVTAPAHKKDTPTFATGGPVWKATVKRTSLPLLPQ